jgi:5-methylcytosine-specific restriction endonuclease McrA
VPARLTTLIERDGPACVWCGHEPWREDLSAEHLLPRSRGGSGAEANLVVACRRCNRRRGSRPVDAYVRALVLEGRAPRLPALASALERLSGSPRRIERRYAAGQLTRLSRHSSPRHYQAT